MICKIVSEFNGLTVIPVIITLLTSFNSSSQLRGIPISGLSPPTMTAVIIVKELFESIDEIYGGGQHLFS